jgi:CheY-like chemotaxis protein
MRILQVEDDPIDVANLRRALAHLNASTSVTPARNGKEALELLRAGAAAGLALPSLVLLDLGMPIMGGLEFLEALRSDDDFRGLPVIVLTASDREEERKRAYELGAVGYVVKPLPLEEFISAIDGILRDWTLNERP